MPSTCSFAVADHHLSHGEVDRALEVLYRCPEGFRGWEWGHLMYRCHQEARSFPAHTNVAPVACDMVNLVVSGLAFDRRGIRVGSVGRNGVARVHELESGRLVLTVGTNGVPATTLAFSPTRDEVAFGFANGEVRVWRDLSGEGEVVASLGNPPRGETGAEDGSSEPAAVVVEHLAYSPDGSKAAAWEVEAKAKAAAGGAGPAPAPGKN